MREYSNNPSYPDGDAYDPTYCPPPKVKPIIRMVGKVREIFPLFKAFVRRNGNKTLGESVSGLAVAQEIACVSAEGKGESPLASKR